MDDNAGQGVWLSLLVEGHLVVPLSQQVRLFSVGRRRIPWGQWKGVGMWVLLLRRQRMRGRMGEWVAAGCKALARTRLGQKQGASFVQLCS